MKHRLALWLLALVACTANIPPTTVRGTLRLERDPTLDGGSPFELVITSAAPVASNPDASVNPDAAPVDASPPPPPPVDAGTVVDSGVPPPPTTGGVREPPDSTNQIEGRDLWPAPVLARPTPGATVVDPTFGTSIRAMPDGARHEYSQLQAFSHDDRYVLLGGKVYDLQPSMPTVVFAVAGGTPRWLPDTHTVVSFVERSPGIRNNIQVLTQSVAAPQPAVLMDLPNLHFMDDARSYEEISRGPRKLVALLVTSRTDKTGSHIVVLNIATRTVAYDYPLTAQFVDWVAVTPDAARLMIQTTSGQGLLMCDLMTGAVIKTITPRHDHGDLGLGSAGMWNFVSTDILHPRNNNVPGIYRFLQSSKTALRMIGWGKSSHISMQGPPGGPAAVTASVTNDDDILKGEIYLVNQDGSLLRLAHHRSTESDYWRQPHASISASGKYVIFASDWGNTANPPTSYVIRVPGT